MAKKGSLPAPEEDGDPTAPFWMTTFSDMATLLLTFFVMIVSMSTVEVKKFKEAISYFQGRTSFLQEDAVLPPVQTQVMAVQSAGGKKQEVLQAEMFEELLSYLEAAGLQDKVQVNMTERGLHVVIIDSLMFDSGSADLLPLSKEVLSRIASAMQPVIQGVVVEGHTDNQPIATNTYPTNWELSSARAMSVVRFLLQQPTALNPSEYVGIGHGEFRPVATNANFFGRAKNRRVEILFSWEPWQNSISPKTKSQSTPESPPAEAARPS